MVTNCVTFSVTILRALLGEERHMGVHKVSHTTPGVGGDAFCHHPAFSW